jgi:hypothetical protein
MQPLAYRTGICLANLLDRILINVMHVLMNAVRVWLQSMQLRTTNG